MAIKTFGKTLFITGAIIGLLTMLFFTINGESKIGMDENIFRLYSKMMIVSIFFTNVGIGFMLF